MSTIFILFSLTLIYLTFGYRKDGRAQENQRISASVNQRPDLNWARQEQQRNGGRPKQQRGLRQNSWKPDPEPHCTMIPNNVETIAITPLVITEVTRNAVFLCDHGSSYQQIAYELKSPQRLTCNGVTTVTANISINVNLTHGNSNRIEETIGLTNFTKIATFNNGNYDTLECGTISSGRCAGDQWWGIIIYRADDQTSCFKNGVRGVRALEGKVELIGRCATRCSLVKSIAKYSHAINNKGLADRALDS